MQKTIANPELESLQGGMIWSRLEAISFIKKPLKTMKKTYHIVEKKLLDVPRKLSGITRKALTLAVLIALFAGMMPVPSSAQTSNETGSIQKELNGSGLPIGRTTVHETPNSIGTAIYLPQIHQEPGSSASDSVNNQAETAQNQIYSIISHLEKNGTNLVMAEGDLYGPVPDEKISLLKNKISAKNDLTSNLQKLNSSSDVDPSLKNKIATDGNKVLSAANRAITLEGAPYRLKAEGRDINLYGAENKTTFDQSANLVRNHIYLQDRISQLSGGMSMQTGSSMPSQTNSLSDALASDLSNMESALPNDSDLKTVSQNIKNDMAVLNQIYRPSGSENGPSRSDNPYSGISNIQTLQLKMRQNEQSINSVVIDQRNKDTAINFAQALKTENKSVGMIQFGSMHESGLVSELQKQGLSVIVVSAQAVGSTQAQTPAINYQTQTPSYQTPSLNTTNPYPTNTQNSIQNQMQIRQQMQNRIPERQYSQTPQQVRIAPANTSQTNRANYTQVINLLRQLNLRKS